MLPPIRRFLTTITTSLAPDSYIRLFMHVRPQSVNAPGWPNSSVSQRKLLYSLSRLSLGLHVLILIHVKVFIKSVLGHLSFHSTWDFWYEIMRALNLRQLITQYCLKQMGWLAGISTTPILVSFLGISSLKYTKSLTLNCLSNDRML